MVSLTQLVPIFRDRFCPPRFGEDEAKVSLGRLLAFIVVPLGIGVLMSLWHPSIPKDYQGTFFQIFAIVATVFTAMLPIIQSVVGSRPRERKYTAAEQTQWFNETQRLNTLRDLYSVLTWAIVLTISAMVPLLLLQWSGLPNWGHHVVAMLIYAVAVSLALAFLEIVADVYLVLKDETDEIEAALRRNKPKRVDDFKDVG